MAVRPIGPLVPFDLLWEALDTINGPGTSAHMQQLILTNPAGRLEDSFVHAAELGLRIPGVDSVRWYTAFAAALNVYWFAKIATTVQHGRTNTAQQLEEVKREYSAWAEWMDYFSTHVYMMPKLDEMYAIVPQSLHWTIDLIRDYIRVAVRIVVDEDVTSEDYNEYMSRIIPLDPEEDSFYHWYNLADTGVTRVFKSAFSDYVFAAYSNPNIVDPMERAQYTQINDLLRGILVNVFGDWHNVYSLHSILRLSWLASEFSTERWALYAALQLTGDDAAYITPTITVTTADLRAMIHAPNTPVAAPSVAPKSWGSYIRSFFTLDGK